MTSLLGWQLTSGSWNWHARRDQSSQTRRACNLQLAQEHVPFQIPHLYRGSMMLAATDKADDELDPDGVDPDGEVTL